METVVKSDIFFFVATIGVVVLTTIFAIIGIYLIKILKDFRKVTAQIKMMKLFIRKILKIY